MPKLIYGNSLASASILTPVATQPAAVIIADFTGSPTSGDAPLSVDFTDLSTGSVSTWAWTFGDEGTSSEQNPTHVYGSPGTYTVTLTVTGPAGSDVATRTAYIVANTSENLILWNKLGSDAEVANSETGPDFTKTGTILYYASKYDNGFYVTNDNNYLSTADLTTMNVSQGTIEFWITPRDNDPFWTNDQNLFWFGPAVGAGAGPTFYGWFSAAAQEIYFLAISNGSWTQGTMVKTGSVTDFDNTPDTHFHLGFVWDSTQSGTDRLDVYIEGVKRPTSIVSPGVRDNDWAQAPYNDPHSPNPVYLGATRTGSNSMQKIAMDNVKIWDYKKIDFSDRIYE
jgi:PKD repeat protein